MTTTTIDARQRRRERRQQIATVTATQLGVHLGITRQRIAALADVEHVIVRLPNGLFDQDDARLRYLRWLRDPERRLARTQADAAHTAVKTEMLQLKLLEKKRALVPADEFDEMIDTFAGLVLTKLGGWPARVAGTDLVMRRRAEAVLFELRTEIANACQAMADKCGEPPLSEQG